MGRGGVWGLLLVALAMATGLVTRWQYAHDNALDDDELQHMHFAWCITQEVVPYRDFWDNHTPALHHLLAHIIRTDAPPSGSFLTARRWMFVVGITTLVATFLLARAVFDLRTALLATAWLSCCEAFLDKTVEIRPDGVLSTAVVLGLWMLVLAMKTPRPALSFLFYFSSGFSYGLGLTFSPKALIPLAFALFAWVVVAWWGRYRLSLRRALGGACGVVVGFALPVVVWLWHEASQGAVGPALRSTLLENFSHFDRFSSWLALETAWPFAFLAFAIAGAVRVVVGLRRGPANLRPALLITIAAVGTGLVYVFVMPSPYLQSTAMFLPSFAILAGYVTAWLVDSAVGARWAGPRRRFAWVGLITCAMVAVIHPILRIQFRRAQQRLVQKGMLEHVDWVHSWTSESDVVFDGRCAAVFRKHALSHPSLVRGVLSAYWAGTLTPPIRDELRTSGCTVVLRDARSGELPPPDEAFIEAHFVQMKDIYESLLLPGRSYDAGELEGEGAMFEVITPGQYRQRRSSPRSVTLLDGSEVTGPTHLDIGVYRLESSGPPSKLTIFRPPGQ